MGNWSITIRGVGPKKTPREAGAVLVDGLRKDGQQILSAEFISDTKEDSLDLLHESALPVAKAKAKPAPEEK